MALNLKDKFTEVGKEHLLGTNVRQFVKGGKKGLHFDERTHTYTLNGTVLLSGTSLIKRYEKPFDKGFIANLTASKNARNGMKHLINKESVKKYWSAIGSRASSLGTSGHAFCEAYWLSNRAIKPLHKVERNAKKLMDYLMDNFDIVDMEVNRGNEKYKIGYTMDIELVSKRTGQYILGDFKFSSKFTPEQYKEIKGRYPEYMLEPFRGIKYRNIPEHKGYIQLNLYKRLIEIDTNAKVAAAFLFHIDGLEESKDWYGDKGYKIYKVPDLSKEIDIILKPHESLKYDVMSKL